MPDELKGDYVFGSIVKIGQDFYIDIFHTVENKVFLAKLNLQDNKLEIVDNLGVVGKVYVRDDKICFLTYDTDFIFTYYDPKTKEVQKFYGEKIKY